MLQMWQRQLHQPTPAKKSGSSSKLTSSSDRRSAKVPDAFEAPSLEAGRSVQMLEGPRPADAAGLLAQQQAGAFSESLRERRASVPKGLQLPHMGQIAKSTAQNALLGHRATTQHRPQGLASNAGVIVAH